MFIDTHCHFDFPPFIDDIQDSLQRASQAGIKKIIVPAVDLASVKRIEMLLSYSLLSAAFGLHPCYVHSEPEQHTFAEYVQRYATQIIAIGEIGLDAMIDIPLSQQQNLFEKQLELAKQFQLPVLIHSRRCHEQVYKILKQHDLAKTGIIHGFAGSTEQAKRFIDLGYKIGVGGVITYPRAQKTRKAIAALPLTALVLETDAPDMPLNGYQGQANRPERIVETFDILCQLRKEPAEQIMKVIYHTTYTMFYS